MLEFQVDDYFDEVEPSIMARMYQLGYVAEHPCAGGLVNKFVDGELELDPEDYGSLVAQIRREVTSHYGEWDLEETPCGGCCLLGFSKKKCTEFCLDLKAHQDRMSRLGCGSTKGERNGGRKVWRGPKNPRTT